MSFDFKNVNNYPVIFKTPVYLISQHRVFYCSLYVLHVSLLYM
uniref:Uncharacterized protein n=1 Tax=Anguilla anguilla TaxID=7936 RepID=A0A0E9W2J6_ANGAN